ncbi:single-stranded DNA-binding protein [Treponema sp.]|uniref:single-stranded DNA-binding protein n=1 Tax=Treponema sp. TaxID=166 RepID=UPI00388EBF89
MLNSINIVGRLVKDPEHRQSTGGVDFTKFVVAVERNRSTQGERLTDYFDCISWRSTADFVSKYFQKGSWIAVSGSMESRVYENKDGLKQRVWEIQVSDVSFAGGRSSGNSDSSAAPAGYEEMPEDDGDLPF